MPAEWSTPYRFLMATVMALRLQHGIPVVWFNPPEI